MTKSQMPCILCNVTGEYTNAEGRMGMFRCAYHQQQEDADDVGCVALANGKEVCDEAAGEDEFVPEGRTEYKRRMIDLRSYPSGYGADALVCQTDDGKWWRKFAGEVAWTEEESP